MHVNSWDTSTLPDQPEDGKFNLMELGLPPLSMRVRVGRNLSDFPLPGAMFEHQRVALERKMCNAFDVLIANPAFGGQYYSLTPGHKNQMSELQYNKLVKDHIMFKDMSKDSCVFLSSSFFPFDFKIDVIDRRHHITWVMCATN